MLHTLCILLAARPAPSRASLLAQPPMRAMPRRELAALAAAAVLAATNEPATAATVADKIAALEVERAAEPRNRGTAAEHAPVITVFGAKVTTGGVASEVEFAINMEMGIGKDDVAHFIEYMWIKDAESGKILAAKRVRMADASPPTLIAALPKGATCIPMSICSIHGVWEGKPFAVPYTGAKLTQSQA